MGIRLPVSVGRAARLLACLLLVHGLSACFTVPKSMQLTAGTDPADADEDVRFRATYYYRVYDYCYDAKAKAQLQPVTDSLYRFVMTGKADAYASKVRFEAGTLAAAQIDPFGATVETDKQTKRLRFVSQTESQARSRRNEVASELEDLLRLKERLVKLNATAAAEAKKDGLAPAEVSRPVAQETIDALDKNITLLTSSGLSVGKLPELEQATTQDRKICPEGFESRRGFQLMGPQGVKTFNQDERLLMAMSTDAEGLLSALQETAGRFLKAEEQRLSDADLLLPLVVEQLRVSELKRLVPAENSSPDTKGLIEKLKKRLEPVEPEDKP